ncbi:MAG: hypothetical protein JWL97_4002 [Gemmatimonadales bacterium]|nr:hypothetical protein [Gemmatimonadales bacterium]
MKIRYRSRGNTSAEGKRPGQPPCTTSGTAQALCDGQDPRLVRDGAFFGFGVDAGVGCFYDHAAGGDIVTVTEDDWETFTEVERDQTLELTASGSDANLITFSSGWGDGAYPTWIGRNVTGFVADMLVLHETEQLAEQR